MLDFSVTFIITIINITVLYFILRKVLFKPVTKFMADRTKRVQDSIDQAESDKTKAQELLAQYEDKLKTAEAEAKIILKNAVENAEYKAQKIVDEGKQEAENTSASLRKQIDTERQAALAKFKLEAATLVVAASGKLAAKDFSGDDNKYYANMLIEELSAQKGSN
ncbi:MAG: ATP synthase F0 subunit B [Treponema sp.]|jgi:F-type H+-transporting ATPase subunit b|nr:ATP synthase F0 subunit B [Treponema sp.]